MSTADHNDRDPLAVELLVDADKRRVSINDHLNFQRGLAANLDAELDEMIEVPWPEIDPPSRRKDAEVARVLDLLDNLPRGKDAE